MRQNRRRSLLRTVLLLGLLLLPALLPIASANAARQAELRQSSVHSSRGIADNQERAPARADDGRDGPIADPTGSPALALSWEAPATHVGVPAILTVRAVDAEGWRDARRGGSVQLFLDDRYAEVYLADAGREAAVSKLSTEAAGDYLQAEAPLQGGTAVLAVLFKTAGSQPVRGHLAGAPEIAGSSPKLIVHDVFFRIEQPAAQIRQAEQARYTIHVRDDEGKPVPAYAGTVSISTSDGNARVADAVSAEHTFRPSERGQTTVDVAFSQDGAQTITVGDGTPWRTATLDLSVVTDEAIARPPSGPGLAGATASFDVTTSVSQVNTGVPLTITVTALDVLGQPDTGYTGTVKLSSTDSAFAPGTTFQYTFTAGDAGVHVFDVNFNTAGAAQTITVYDKDTPAITGTSPAVQVDETILHVSFASGTVEQGVAINMTVEAKDGQGQFVTGYRGTVGLTSTWDGVHSSWWGSGVTGFNPPRYTFTAGDAGNHTFTPKFAYAGDQTATITDVAQPTRTVTSSTLVVTNTPASFANRVAQYYSHWSTPAGVELDSGVTVWASLALRGRLYVKRNLGTMREPAWTPGEVVQTEAWDYLGADSPSLVVMPDDSVALFYSYTDGTFYQIWMTTSDDEGQSWSTPVLVTSEAGHVGRIQTVVDGNTLYLFWSRRDTNQKLFYQTTTDLANWSSKQTVSQQIGVPIAQTTTNFGVTKLSDGGDWVLGWLWTSTNTEQPGADHNLNYPTVHVARSSNLSTWLDETELHLPYTQRLPESVAIGEDPDRGYVYAVYEHYDYPWDTYMYARVSEDGGQTWNPEAQVGYDHSAAPDGWQGYDAKLPSLFFVDEASFSYLSCSMAAQVPGSATVKGEYGMFNGADSATAVMPCELDAANPLAAEGERHLAIVGGPSTPDSPTPNPPGDNLPPDIDCPTGPCTEQGYPVNTQTGYQSTSATDFVLPGRGSDVVTSRTYQGFDAYAGLASAFGIGWNWTYGSRAILHNEDAVTIIDTRGKRLRFEYVEDTGNFRPGSAAAVYQSAQLAFDGNGDYALTYRDQTVWTYSSDGSEGGRLIGVTDPNGNQTTLTYDVDGYLETITAPGGRQLTITTDTEGRITRIDAPESLYTTYTYDTEGHLLTATDAAGATTTYTYNSEHLMLTVVDANNHTVESNTYGSLGRVIEQEDADQNVISFTYDSLKPDGTSGPHKFTDGRGNQTWYWHDEQGRLSERQVKQGFTTILTEEWTYDAQNQVASYTDGNGVLTTFTYDSNGNMLTETRDSGPWAWNLNLTTTYTYDGQNNLLTVTDPLSHTTTMTYDANSNLLTIKNHLNETTTFTYDQYGQLETTTDPELRTVTYGYGADGDLETISLPGGADTRLGYDDAGRLISINDANRHVTTFAYNGRGQVTTITNELSQVTSMTYDTVGNLTVVTDALTRTTDYDYDALNRLVKVTDALNGKTDYGYDANGNLTSLTDANDHTTSYTYDGANRVVTMTDPLSEVWTYTYDDNHNLTLVEQPNGKDVSYVYDAIDRLTGIDLLDDTSLDIEYGYDDASRRTSMIDATGTTAYAYDDANRLSSLTAPTTGTVSYGYNDASQRTNITYPSTHQVTYGYNARGELETVTDWLSGVTTYSYDPAGRLTEIDYPNGVTGTLDYDAADRLTQIAYADGLTALETISYVVNAVGMRASMSDSTGTTDYTYDALYRLTEVEYPNSDLTEYGYDAVGNRASLTINGGTPITNTYNDANALTASGSDSYAYDDNGNLTSKTVNSVTTTYTWDALNRMTGLADGTTTASYAYNGDGMRLAKTVNSVTTNYTWDQMGLGYVIADGREYVRGHGLISQITAGGTPTYAHSDALGSVRLLTDDLAASVGTETFDAFGASRSQTGTQLAFGFTGEQTDQESGLVYLRARYMDPIAGRFISRDPYQGVLDVPASIHRYAYALNNPVRYTDPSGLAPPSLDPGSSCSTEEDSDDWPRSTPGDFLPDDVISDSCANALVGAALSSAGDTLLLSSAVALELGIPAYAATRSYGAYIDARELSDAMKEAGFTVDKAIAFLNVTLGPLPGIGTYIDEVDVYYSCVIEPALGWLF